VTEPTDLMQMKSRQWPRNHLASQAGDGVRAHHPQRLASSPQSAPPPLVMAPKRQILFVPTHRRVPKEMIATRVMGHSEEGAKDPLLRKSNNLSNNMKFQIYRRVPKEMSAMRVMVTARRAPKALAPDARSDRKSDVSATAAATSTAKPRPLPSCVRGGEGGGHDSPLMGCREG
jgi:hypothetical protein